MNVGSRFGRPRTLASKNEFIFSLSLSFSFFFSLFQLLFGKRTNERTNKRVELWSRAGPGLQPTTTKVELLRISNYTTLHYTVTHFPIWAKPSRAEPSQAKRLFVRSFTRPFVRPSDRHYQGRSWWWVSFSLSLLPSSSSSSSLSTLEHIKIQNRQPNKHTRDFTLFFTCGHTAQKERETSTDGRLALPALQRPSYFLDYFWSV